MTGEVPWIWASEGERTSGGIVATVASATDLRASPVRGPVTRPFVPDRLGLWHCSVRPDVQRDLPERSAAQDATLEAGRPDQAIHLELRVDVDP